MRLVYSKRIAIQAIRLRDLLDIMKGFIGDTILSIPEDPAELVGRQPHFLCRKRSYMTHDDRIGVFNTAIAKMESMMFNQTSG